MDRLTEIELEFKNVMLSIDGSTTPTGYTYYNDVSVVNIDDECVVDDIGDYPTVAIYLDPDEKIMNGEQHAFRNKASFKLVVEVSNDGEEGIPKFEINKKMNEMLSDIKAVLSSNYHLNETVDITNIKSSKRYYSTGGDEYRAGDLHVMVECIYTQSRLNPDLHACM